MNAQQLELPMSVPETERDYHAFKPWRYDGAPETPLGCKVCNFVLWHPIHSRTEGAYVELTA